MSKKKERKLYEAYNVPFGTLSMQVDLDREVEEPPDEPLGHSENELQNFYQGIRDSQPGAYHAALTANYFRELRKLLRGLRDGGSLCPIEIKDIAAVESSIVSKCRCKLDMLTAIETLMTRRFNIGEITLLSRHAQDRLYTELYMPLVKEYDRKLNAVKHHIRELNGSKVVLKPYILYSTDIFVEARKLAQNYEVFSYVYIGGRIEVKNGKPSAAGSK